MSVKRQKSREVSPASEEYLETIYKLEEQTGSARTSDLVDQLKVAPGSITNTIESLERQGLIVHEPYRGVRLTEVGRQIALSVIRRHRLFERLLTDVLHLEWSKAHEAACKLEHGATREVTERIEETLGHPSSCPHGNPIPTESGEISEEKSQPLGELDLGERGVIVKIVEERRDVLEYLSNLQLVPGAAVQVEEKLQPDGPITVKVAGASRALSRDLASVIRVKQVSGEETEEPLVEPVNGMSGNATAINEREMMVRRYGRIVSITELKPGQKARIAFVRGGSRVVQRLADLGLTPETVVSVLKAAPFHGPVEVAVRGSRLAIGRGIAEKILVQAEAA